MQCTFLRPNYQYLHKHPSGTVTCPLFENMKNPTSSQLRILVQIKINPVYCNDTPSRFSRYNLLMSSFYPSIFYITFFPSNFIIYFPPYFYSYIIYYYGRSQFISLALLKPSHRCYGWSRFISLALLHLCPYFFRISVKFFSFYSFSHSLSHPFFLSLPFLLFLPHFDPFPVSKVLSESVPLDSDPSATRT